MITGDGFDGLDEGEVVKFLIELNAIASLLATHTLAESLFGIDMERWIAFRMEGAKTNVFSASSMKGHIATLNNIQYAQVLDRLNCGVAY